MTNRMLPDGNTNEPKLANATAEAKLFAMNQHSLISISDVDGKITYANSKFIEVSGYSKKELLGQNHRILNSGNQSSDYWRKMYETVSAGNVWHDEVRNVAKDGHFYWVDTTIVPNYEEEKFSGYTSVRTEITRQKENVELLKLAKAKSKARAIAKAEATQYAMDQHSLVSVTNVDGNITYVNSKFIEVSGYSESELLGQNHRILNSANQTSDYWRKMYETVSAGNVWHDEVRNVAKGGHFYWEDTTIVPNYEEDKFSGYTSVRTEITQQKENSALLKDAKLQAEAANVTKADFLANMSHEIRTPMNGIIGMTNQLLSTELSNEQLKLAKTVKSSGESLLAIINDILDFSKVEAGKLELEIIPFNFGRMVEDLGSTMIYQAKDKGLQFICPANPIMNMWVKGDPGRIRQILTNLIGNAIKFTAQGEVAVYTHVEELNNNCKKIHFEVKDTGIGITQEQQEKLFAKFSQADASTTRKYGGTGLGLSICKKMVELMDGDIGIKSVHNEGSTFWFTIELEGSEVEDDATIFTDDLHNQKILIVDDNETNRDLMHQLHNIWKIPHELVDSGEAALQELKKAADVNAPYSIAILDMCMPGMDGLELSKHIQADTLLNNTKLIMTTSQPKRGDANIMKSMGIKGYLPKPIHQSELFDVLLLVSGLKENSKTLITRHLTKGQQKFKGHVLVVEDNPTNQLVIEGLLATLGLTIDLAVNGEEAVAILQSGANHDLVFMDCQMPVMDGYTATANIRAGDAIQLNTGIPIIAMTANAMAGDKQKCLDFGMSDYISKPIDPAKVIAKLKQWLPAQVSQPKPKEELSAALSEIDESIPVFDFDDMSARLMHKKELMVAVSDIFFNDTVNQISEIKEYTKQNNIEQAMAVAHKIKGASANVGGMALSALACDIEIASKAGEIDNVSQKIAMLDASFASLKTAMQDKLL